MRTCFLVRLALFALFLSSISAGMAQASLPIYTDNLVNGFQDWSWASHDLANTSPANSGIYSISVSDGAWTALSFYHADFNATPYTNLTFWAHGGTSGGQQLQVYVQYGPGGTYGTTVTLPSTLTAGTWKQYKITLSALGVANRSDVNRFTIQLTSSGTTDTFYVDDIALTAAKAPALVHLNVDANATTGTLTFTTPATSASGAGSYAINGSGLTANNGNYTFAQAAGNATALSILPLVTPAFAARA